MNHETLFVGSLLVVMAHPDDAEILCFGTIARHLAGGGKAHLLIVCGGDGGVAVRDASSAPAPDVLTRVRREETERAFMRALNSGLSLEFVGRRDGAIVADRQLISEIEAVQLRVQPVTVITHTIDRSGADHQDHAAVGQATTNAVKRSRTAKWLLHAEPESITTPFVANYFVNIADFFEEKVASLACHESQKGRTYLTREFHLQRCRSNALRAGPGHFESGQLFEAFDLIRAVV